jgi:non-specific serine/threonine protein kinase
MNDNFDEAVGLLVLGIAKMQGGELERAGALVEESLVLHRELGLDRDVAECLEVMAEVAGGLGEERRAAWLWGAAGALRQATDNPWVPSERRLHEPYLASARSRMEEADWGEAWRRGGAMTLDEAISYALEEEAGA